MTPKYVTIERAAELTGYSAQAIRDKKHDGVWPEGVWVKAPDGRVLINLEEYESWVETGVVSKQPRALQSKSPSPIGVSSARKGSDLSPLPLI